MMFGAIAAAVIGGGINLFGASQANSASRSAAAKANKLQEEQAKAQYDRALQEYNLNYQQNMTNWYWEQALTEQGRRVEAQAAIDQATAGQQMIWMAQSNYLINSSSLFDQYVLGEQVRFVQESMNLQNTVAGLQSQIAGMQNQQAGLQNQKLGIDNRIAGVQLETAATVARYMSQVAENGARADIVVAQAQNKVDEVVTAMAAREVEENTKYEMQLIGGALEAAIDGNRALTQSGGSNSAKQLAGNRMKEALRNYALVYQGRNARDAQIGVLNSVVNNEYAKQIGLLAEQSRGAEQQAGFAKQIGANQIEGLQIQKTGLDIQSAGIGIQMSEAQRQIGFANNFFNAVTMPTFTLSQAQYQREILGLQVETINSFQNALLPYRQREYFNPLQPIAGIAPTYYAPTPVYAPQQNLFGSFLQGAQSFSPGLFSTIIPNELGKIFG